jgi:3-methyladenine DNA glycosylase AlkD
MKFCSDLEADFLKASNSELAIPMEKYMKNNFSFLGIKTEQRRAIFKSNYEQNKVGVKEFKKNFVLEDIQLIEKLIITNSWWDSVDTIAKYILGGYLLQFPSETLKVVERFSDSENMWLNRSAILFQLSYKDKTNFEILKSECEKHKDSNEFFIQKAIGWALRDYSRFNPKGVEIYVNSTNLKPLIRREALRLL